MSEEEIRKLALSLGLDSRHLVIHEPFSHNRLGFSAIEYSWEYKHAGNDYNFHFSVPAAEFHTGREEIIIKKYVNIGLSQLVARLIAEMSE